MNAPEPRVPLADLKSHDLADDFGKPGEPGAMRVRFYSQGGDIFSLHLLDHFYDVKAKYKAEPAAGDYLLLVHGGADGDASLELRQDSASSLFASGELTGKGWEMVKGVDSLTFKLASQSGVVLTKTWRHHAARRELSLEIEGRFDPKVDPRTLLHMATEGCSVLLGDGSVRFLAKTIDAKVLRAMITRSGGEVISMDP